MSNDTAQRLLEAATQLFSERGYGGTSARAIAERAGVAKPLVFYHWGNKETLRDAVLRGTLQGLHETLERASRLGETPTERLRNTLEAYMDFLEAVPAYARLLVHELADEGGRHEIIADHNRANLGLMSGLFVEMGAVPGTATDPTQLFLSFAGIALHSFISRRALSKVAPEGNLRRDHIRWMSDRVIAQLQADRAAR